MTWKKKANIRGPEGKPGKDGPPGGFGPMGVGVPGGGTTGQVLKKKSNGDYDTEWGTDSGPISSINVTAPLESTGGSTPTLSLQEPTTSPIVTDIDWSILARRGGIYTHDLANNETFTFSNVGAGQTILVRITNDPSNYTVTWPTVKWSGGAAPTMTIGAKSDIYTFISDGVDVFGSFIQDMS
jgi:hypothetical protein